MPREKTRKKIKLTLGPCKFTGKFKCSCSSGSYISATSGSISRDATCTECGHLLYIHEDFEEEQHDLSDDVTVVSDSEAKIKIESPVSCSPMPIEQPTLSPTEPIAPVTSEGPTKNEPPTSDAHMAGVEASQNSPATNIASTNFEKVPKFTCPRQRTVAHIAGGLRSNRALLIWGGCFTGKTTLARLLERYLKGQGKVAIYISSMDLDEGSDTSSFDWESFLWRFFYPRYPSTNPLDRKIEGEVYFIIDQAQCTWKTSSSFLTKILIPYLWETSGPRFCFFGLGPPNKASSSAVTAVSSIEIWEQRFLKSTLLMSLYYSESEFYDVTEKYCLHAHTAIHLSKSAQKYLYYLTNGHPKLVSSCLVLVDEICREAADQPQSQSLRRKMSLNAIKRILEDDETVFGRGETGYGMGGPPPSPLNDGDDMITLLRIVLLRGKISCSRILCGSAIYWCYCSGFLIMQDDSPNGFLVFPSPLHRRYIKWFYKI